MSRRISASIVFLALLVVCGCSGGAEQQLLQKYFNAAKLRDQTTLANIATVRFDPQTDGIVQSFTVTSVGEEQRRTLRLRDLKKAHDEAKAADDEFSKRKRAYQDANLEAIDRVLKAEAQNRTLRGRDLEVQATWTKWRDEMAQKAKALSSAGNALSAERGIAEISVFDPRNPVDVTQYDGELVSREVTVAAKVRTPAGEVVDRTMVVTLEQAQLKKDGADLNGRWLITAIK
jgi:hypothetical protein